MGVFGARFDFNRYLPLVAAGLLTACGGGETQAPAATTAPTDLTAPADAGEVGQSTAAGLAGEAESVATVGTPYTFSPTVEGGATASFSVTSLPPWATFDSQTGAITGQPDAGDVGVHRGITITALVDGVVKSLAPFDVTVLDPSARAAARTATLTWNPPTQNVDGTSLSDLAGYRIYYGNDEGAAEATIDLKNPGLTAYTINDLAAGTYYFAIAAINTAGVEGERAAIGSTTLM